MLLYSPLLGLNLEEDFFTNTAKLDNITPPNKATFREVKASLVKRTQLKITRFPHEIHSVTEEKVIWNLQALCIQHLKTNYSARRIPNQAFYCTKTNPQPVITATFTIFRSELKVKNQLTSCTQLNEVYLLLTSKRTIIWIEIHKRTVFG